MKRGAESVSYVGIQLAESTFFLSDCVSNRRCCCDPSYHSIDARVAGFDGLRYLFHVFSRLYDVFLFCFDRYGSGEVVGRITGDVLGLSDFLSDFLSHSSTRLEYTGLDGTRVKFDLRGPVYRIRCVRCRQIEGAAVWVTLNKSQYFLSEDRSYIMVTDGGIILNTSEFHIEYSP